MLVSNNSLLNILLPNENKVLKDVLKEADIKTLNNIKTGNTSIGDILKNLFSDLSTGEKNKTTIENILKNSNLFKDLGSFTKSIESLLSQVKEDSNLAKYKPQLESFLKNISQIDNNSLKDLISKSGVFLESKVLEQSKTNTTLPKNLENILNQIKTVLNDIPKDILKNMQTFDTKKIENLIDKILQNNSKATNNTNPSTTNTSDLKALISQLQNLSKNIGNNQLGNLTLLTNNLKDISTKSQLNESKIANQNPNTQPNLMQTRESLNVNTQQILTQLKSELLTSNTIPNAQNIIKQIDNLLQSNSLFSQNQTTLNQTTLNQTTLNQSALDVKNLLFTLKENITTITTNQSPLLAQQNIIKIVNQLDTIVNNFINNSSFSLQGNEKNPQQQNPLQNDMKTVLLKIQEELGGRTDIKATDTFKQVDKMLMQVEYYQLLSIASNSNSVYIPFIWDMLDDGSLSIKKLDEEKFYCEINLSLKEFGQTQLLLSLYDKNKLDLTIYASKDSFKQAIRENAIKLKQALNKANLIPVNINILNLKEAEDKPKEEQQIEVYSQNINLGFGIDIKA
ncbi:MAG: flagellar hook-length control protein FliK [Halarcobacter sp.]